MRISRGRIRPTVRPQTGAQRPLSSDEIERMLALKRQGVGLRRIAKEMRRGVETIRAAYEEHRP